MSALSSEARAEQITAALAGASVRMEPGALQIEARDDRLAVRLPGERMAWFPLNDEGRAILAKERRVLRLLETYCAFQAPRVLYETSRTFLR